MKIVALAFIVGSIYDKFILQTIYLFTFEKKSNKNFFLDSTSGVLNLY